MPRSQTAVDGMTLNTHCQYDSSRTPPIHTDTLAHTRGCVLGQKWPQSWLWIVIPASAGMTGVTSHGHPKKTPTTTTTTYHTHYHRQQHTFSDFSHFCYFFPDCFQMPSLFQFFFMDGNPALNIREAVQ